MHIQNSESFYFLNLETHPSAEWRKLTTQTEMLFPCWAKESFSERLKKIIVNNGYCGVFPHALHNVLFIVFLFLHGDSSPQ